MARCDGDLPGPRSRAAVEGALVPLGRGLRARAQHRYSRCTAHPSCRVDGERGDRGYPLMEVANDDRIVGVGGPSRLLVRGCGGSQLRPPRPRRCASLERHGHGRDVLLRQLRRPCSACSVAAARPASAAPHDADDDAPRRAVSRDRLVRQAPLARARAPGEALACRQWQAHRPLRPPFASGVARPRARPLGHQRLAEALFGAHAVCDLIAGVDGWLPPALMVGGALADGMAV